MKRIRKAKNNKKIIWIIVGIIVLISVGVIIFLNYRKNLTLKNKANIVFVKDTDIEINDEVILDYFVKEIMNGKLLNGDEKVDTSKLGKKKLVFSVKNKNDEEETFNLSVNIVDTTKPEIDANEEISAYVGSNIDLLKEVSVKDNSLEEIDAKVIGDYDINKEGEYKLKYEASDSSGNKSSFDFVLKVTDDPNNRVFTTSKGFSGKTVNGVTYIDGVLIANKTYSLPSSYGTGLTSETRNAFNKCKRMLRHWDLIYGYHRDLGHIMIKNLFIIIMLLGMDKQQRILIQQDQDILSIRPG